MASVVKGVLKGLSKTFLNFITEGRVGEYVNSQVIARAMVRKQSVKHEGVEIILSTPNSLNEFRASSFSVKEPETLEWIDQIPNGSIVWDIGANVGLYSCYAAKKRGCRVFSFEPSIFNLELLARNIFNNQLQDLITIVPLPLSESLSVNKLNMSSTEWGGALSTFGYDFGHDGEKMDKVFEFSTIGISMLDAVKLLNIPQPDYIKLDVDGIEHLILKGGLSVLQNVKGILIEINDDFEKQAGDAMQYLVNSGLVLKEKRHAEYFDNTIFNKTFNQIWQRIHSA
jgi:FkbM family methyltransferase